MGLSVQQQAVIDWAGRDNGSAIVKARAGCGKTFTLLELVEFIVKNGLGDVSLTAFNKKIAEEISKRLEARGIKWRDACAQTSHAAALAAYRKVYPGVQINADKLEGVMDRTIGMIGQPMQFVSQRSIIRKAVSLAKQRAFGYDQPAEEDEAWADLIEHFGLDENLPEGIDMNEFIGACQRTFFESMQANEEVIDFDDMILAPLASGCRIFYRKWVLVDEAQDTNPARRALAYAMMSPYGGRMVGVGDDKQAIYGFTGADNDALDQLASNVKAITLPLNVTWRCPKLVVKEAQLYVPDFTAHESNPDGVVRSIKYKDFHKEQLRPDDLIICRLTYPLIEVAYDLIRRRIPCRVEGRDIGEGLIVLAKRWKIANIRTLMDRLNDYCEKEVAKLMEQKKEHKAQSLEDKVKTLLLFCEMALADGETTIEAVIRSINELFGDVQPGERRQMTTLLTGHRSKGLEAPRCFQIGMNKFNPSPKARKPWQIEQENNISYVQLSRAMEELVYVEL